nr:uncharacterized protein LOC109174707 [Ipomoea batatas]
MAASAGGVYCRSRQFTVSASAERRRRRSTKSVTVASEAAPAEEGRLRLRWWRQMEAFVEDGWRRLNVGGVVVALNLLAEEMESRGNGGRLWGEGTENGENEVEIESRGESFMLERFRSLTEEALDKPDNGIMTMCENIRGYLMVRMQQNRDNMKKHPLKIFPKIMKLVEEAKDKFNECTAYRSKDDVYEVEDCYGRKYKVDLTQYHCSCRRWDLTDIPCSHSIAAIRRKGCIHEEHVNNGYTVESYLRSYELAILLVTSSELWHKTGLPPQLPPKYKTQPGRPKRKRKMGLAESATYQARNKGKAIEEEADVVVEIKKETELTMGVEEAEPKVELQDVVETQDMMNPQPSQNVGNHEPQVSYFISSHMEQLRTPDNVIKKGGR